MHILDHPRTRLLAGGPWLHIQINHFFTWIYMKRKKEQEREDQSNNVKYKSRYLAYYVMPEKFIFCEKHA